MKKVEKKREESIERAIRLVWDSLESHLKPTYLKLESLDKERGETHTFHKKCVTEYAEVIKLLSELY